MATIQQRVLIFKKSVRMLKTIRLFLPAKDAQYCFSNQRRAHYFSCCRYCGFLSSTTGCCCDSGITNFAACCACDFCLTTPTCGRYSCISVLPSCTNCRFCHRRLPKFGASASSMILKKMRIFCLYDKS